MTELLHISTSACLWLVISLIFLHFLSVVFVFTCGKVLVLPLWIKDANIFLSGWYHLCKASTRKEDTISFSKQGLHFWTIRRLYTIQSEVMKAPHWDKLKSRQLLLLTLCKSFCIKGGTEISRWWLQKLEQCWPLSRQGTGFCVVTTACTKRFCWPWLRQSRCFKPTH